MASWLPLEAALFLFAIRLWLVFDGVVFSPWLTLTHQLLFSPACSYLYISVIYNVCYTIALYYLLIFYVGCEELLEVRRERGKPLLQVMRSARACSAREISSYFTT